MQFDKSRKPVYKKENNEKKEFKIEFKMQEFLNADLDKLEGRNSVLEAIKSERSINKILIAKGDREGSIRQIVTLAKEKGIVYQEVDKSILDNMSSTHAHQGVIAYVSIKQYVEVDDI